MATTLTLTGEKSCRNTFIYLGIICPLNFMLSYLSIMFYDFPLLLSVDKRIIGENVFWK